MQNCNFKDNTVKKNKKFDKLTGSSTTMTNNSRLYPIA